MNHLASSTSLTSKPAPMSWVEKLFSRLGATFGSRFHDMWRNEDIATVKSVWASELGKLSVEEVKVGVEQLTRLTRVPNLGEFIAHCKSCRRDQVESTAPRLEMNARAALETVEANMPRMRAAVGMATRSTASTRWAYEMLIRGTAANGSPLNPETRGHAVDAVISWAGLQAIYCQQDAALAAHWTKIRNEYLQSR